MGRSRKGAVEQTKTNQKKKQKNACERHRSVGSFVMTSGLSAEPAYVNILNGIVDAMETNEPQEAVNVLFSEEM